MDTVYSDIETQFVFLFSDGKLFTYTQDQFAAKQQEVGKKVAQAFLDMCGRKGTKKQKAACTFLAPIFANIKKEDSV